MTGWRE